MTRENKLALVVGFGLILFVGILISDHFSTARSQQAASLINPGMVDPLAASGSNSDLVALTNLNPPTPAVNTTDRPTEAARPEQTNTVFDGALNQDPLPRQEDVRQVNVDAPTLDPKVFVPVPIEPPAIKVTHAMHEVRGGDTFFKISRQYYGDASLAGALAKFNQIEPTALREGRRLQIPPAELIGGKPASNPKPAATPANPPSLRISRESTAVAAATAPKTNTAPSSIGDRKNASVKTYTVKSGDSLANIAHRQFGSKAKWKKIYDLNRDVIDDPDNVKVGTVLKLL